MRDNCPSWTDLFGRWTQEGRANHPALQWAGV